MSTNLYPPVRAPTLDQELLSSSGTRIHPSQYKTLDFSPLFQSIYGRPTTTYHAWERLWSIPSSRILEVVCPRYPSATTNFLGFAGYQERFVEFCLEVDGCCGDSGGEGAMMVGRLEMEGAWVKVLLGLFEEMRGQREKMRAFVGMRVGGGEGRLLMTIREVEGEMRDVLRRAVEQRFGKNAEAYWDRKWRIHGFRCPDLDFKRVTDWSVEAPFQKSLLKPEDINDNDYDETDDEHEHEHENRNNNQDHDESNDENNDSAVAMEGIEKKQNPTPNSTEETVQDAMSEDSDTILGANQNMKNPEAKLPKEEETAGTRETLKQEMRLEESDGMHGSLAFSD